MSEGQIIGFGILGAIMAFLYIGEYLLKNMDKKDKK
jgi:mannose/fructose/N-acetylgalactosamine-specific phosphotransferase system component IIC